MSSPLVEIKSLNKSKTSPSGTGDMVDAYLDITPPPAGWISIFNDQWKSHLYLQKRDAQANATDIRITCCLDELKPYHIAELKKVIVETDAIYLRAKAEKERKEKIQTNRENEFRSSIDRISDDLDL